MNEIAFISVVGFVLVALCVIIINQMLMVSAINKRLVALAQDAICALGKDIDFSNVPDLKINEEEYDSFDPHSIEE